MFASSADGAGRFAATTGAATTGGAFAVATTGGTFPAADPAAAAEVAVVRAIFKNK